MKGNIQNKVIGAMIAVLIALSVYSYGQSPCTADAGFDVTICSGDTAKLTASGGESYLWSTGDTTACISASPNFTNIYTVTITNDGCTASDNVIVFVSKMPSVSVVQNQTICYGDSVELSAYGGFIFLWSNSATGRTIYVSPSTSSVYTVTISAYNGCSASLETFITVNPLPIADVGSDQTICRGDNISLSAQGYNNNYYYFWVTGEVGQSIIVAPYITTKYYLYVQQNGCTASDDVVVNVLIPPIADSWPEISINNGQSTVLSERDATINYYNWSNGSTDKIITVNPTITTTYLVTLTGKNGCSSTDQKVVFVGPFKGDIVWANYDKTICEGQSVTLNAIGTVKYLWSNGDTTSSVMVSPSITTTYIVTGTKSGITSTDDVIVFVDKQIVADAGPDQTICFGDRTILNAQGGDKYFWSNFGETTASINVFPTTNSTYWVTVTKGACTSSDMVTIFVNELRVDAGPNQTICQGDSAVLNASGANNYVWSTGDTSQNIVVKPNLSVTYTVTGYKDGCSNSSSVGIMIHPHFNIDAGPDQTICSGSTTMLSATGGSNYTWVSAGGFNNINVAPTTTTTYTVWAYDIACFVTDELVIYVIPPPEIDAGKDVSINMSQSTVLKPTGNSVAYFWDNNDTGKTITVNPTINTTYHVTGTGTNGCTASDEVVVFVSPYSGNSVWANYDRTICEGQSTTLSAYGDDTYLWSNGDTISSITVSPSITTTYIVTGTKSGITSTDDVIVFVDKQFIADAGQDKTICSGDTVTLTASEGDLYLWSCYFNNTKKSITDIPSASTSYFVTVTKGACTSSASVFVTVIWPYADAGPDQTISKGSSVTLNASENGTYLWNTGDTTASIIVSPLKNTTYTLTVFNSACSAKDNVAVSVYNASVSGKFYNDDNDNGKKDPGETDFKNGMIKIIGKGNNYLTLSADGYRLFADTGTYIIKPVVPQYYTVKPDSYIVNIKSFTSLDSLMDFGFHKLMNYNDLGISVTTYSHIWTNFRQGQGGAFEVRYYNNGPYAMDGCFKVVKDVRLIKTYKNISNDTLTYCFKNLLPGESRSVLIYFKINEEILADDIFRTTAYFDPPVVGDINLNDNKSTFTAVGLRSYDPNDIEVNKDKLPLDKIKSGDTLEYTIRFQNSGNDTAFYIRVRDSISDKLDISTLKVITSSHNYSLNIKDNDIIDFVFDNINLPDSGKNQMGSCGFIKYNISPKKSLQADDKILNKAYIYFDYNKPVITNTAVTEIKQLIVDPGDDIEICKGGSTELKIRNYKNGIKYQWSTGDTTISIKVNPGQSTTYKVTATLGNITASGLVSVFVKDLPTGYFKFPDVWINEPIVFQDSSYSKKSKIISWNWNFGDGITSDVKSPNHLYNKADEYNVSLIVADYNGCRDTVTKLVRIYDTLIPYFHGLNICYGNTADLIDLSSLPDNELVKRIWDFGDMTKDTSNSKEVFHMYSKPGNYLVKLIVNTKSGKIDSVERTINVYETPHAAFIIEPDHGNVYDTIEFFDRSTSPGSSIKTWVWNFGDKFVTIAQNTSHVYTKEGVYNVNLRVINEYGCIDTLNRIISITKNTVSVDELHSLKNELRINPNPFNNLSVIEYNLNVSSKIEIYLYDMVGNKIANLLNEYSTEGKHSFTLNRKNLEAGIYFVEMNTSNVRIVRKVVVE